MSFLIGQTVGDYAILQEVGGGGFGRVYKVEHTLTRRREAMKVLAVGEGSTAEQSERFLREIRLQASLNHPNIAAVLNAFWTDDHVVLICEFLEGESLKNLLERGRLPLTQTLHIMSQVLSALVYAQARGVIHRDVSPANIFVTANGGPVKLIDFGLAKAAADLHVTQEGPVGSFHYMSPEQVRGLQTLDSRSDIYSCGAVLYELATGQKLFEGDSGFAIMQAHVEQPPQAPKSVNPEVPPLLEEVILRAIAKNPEDRFQSADSFSQALQHAWSGLDRRAGGRRPDPARSLAAKALTGAAGLALTIALAAGAVRWVPGGNVPLKQTQMQAVSAPASAPVSAGPAALAPAPITKPAAPVASNAPSAWPRTPPTPRPGAHQETQGAADKANSETATPKNPVVRVGGVLKRLNPFGRKATHSAETTTPE